MAVAATTTNPTDELKRKQAVDSAATTTTNSTANQTTNWAATGNRAVNSNNDTSSNTNNWSQQLLYSAPTTSNGNNAYSEALNNYVNQSTGSVGDLTSNVQEQKNPWSQQVTDNQQAYAKELTSVAPTVIESAINGTIGNNFMTSLTAPYEAGKSLVSGLVGNGTKAAVETAAAPTLAEGASAVDSLKSTANQINTGAASTATSSFDKLGDSSLGKTVESVAKKLGASEAVAESIGTTVNTVSVLYSAYQAYEGIKTMSDNRAATAVSQDATASAATMGTIGAGIAAVGATAAAATAAGATVSSCMAAGAAAGPWGLVIGALVGCAMYGVANWTGVGRTTDLGFSESTGRHSTDTSWEDLTSVDQNQYNNYASGMNAVNMFNQSQVGNNAASVGDMAEGYHTTKTKGLWGAYKDKNYEYRINPNTGDIILDDYTAATSLNKGWDDYANEMNAGYTTKLNNSIQNYQDIVEDAIEDRYGLGNAASSVEDADAAQKSEAQRLLANIYNTGDISRSAYTSGLSDIDKQSIANKKNLYDLAEAQNTKWQDMMNEAIAADEDAQIDDQDWMRNYSSWNLNRGGSTAGLLTDMYDRTLNYMGNNLNDDYYNQMLASNSSYLPYASLTDAYATGDAVTNNDLQNWQDLLLLGNKRKAKQLQYGAE